jgi:type IV pilus assembly protein PilQ
MKRKWPWLWTSLLAASLLLAGVVSVALAAPEASVGYVEEITAGPLPGKERVTLVLSRITAPTVEAAPGGGVLIKVPDMFIPEGLRSPLGEGALSNILRIVPEQRTVGGRQWAYVRVDLKQPVQYYVRQEGLSVIVDFNVAGLNPPPLAAERTVAAAPVPAAEEARPAAAPTAAVQDPLPGGDEKQYSGKRISLDFQDANIKSVLRLLSEVSGMSLVSGDDVKGNVTVHMNNVPWDQALDVILDIKGLTKKQMGDVISIITLEKAKKDEADRQAKEEARIKAESLEKEREQKLKQVKGKLRQISIEARIVEAEEGFGRDLGIQWGVGKKSSFGSHYDYAAVAQSANAMGDNYNLKGLASSGIALSTANLALNFPVAAAAPALGFVLSGTHWLLDAELMASELTNRVKVISSPKVLTMEGVEAKIKQGEQVPNITPASGDNPATVSYKDAFLELAVTPKITDEGRISMKIKASNNSANYAKAILGNPPINTSEVDSNVVVNDGDTLVIGGVIKTTESKAGDAVPWIARIPLLGWLFKYENVEKGKKELLIFVTPTIIKDDAVAAAAPPA